MQRRTTLGCVLARGVDISRYFYAAITDLLIAYQNLNDLNTPHSDLSGRTPKEVIMHVALILRLMKRIMCRNKEKNKQYAHELLEIVYSEFEKNKHKQVG